VREVWTGRVFPRRFRGFAPHAGGFTPSPSAPQRATLFTQIGKPSDSDRKRFACATAGPPDPPIRAATVLPARSHTHSYNDGGTPVRRTARKITGMLGRQTGNHAGRAALAAAISALLISGSGMCAGVASTSDEHSFPGCPLLLEGKSGGPCVEKLQSELDTVNPGYNLVVTKTFDAPTRIAVLDFQGRNHLGADGNVGPITADALQKQYETIANPQPQPQPQALAPANHGKVSVEYRVARIINMQPQWKSTSNSAHSTLRSYPVT
jgi:hypothetical protein